jgi:hypothetical protein
LPEQSPADYSDLTRVNGVAQNRFSDFLGSKLDTLLSQSLDRRP